MTDRNGSARVVVIGAGQAGFSAAARLRALGHEGPLTLVGDEPVAPYQRPPLSKAYVTGDMGLDRLFLRPESFYAEAGIVLQKGRRAVGIDRVERRVSFEDGGVLDYDKLILATGSRPRRLPEAIGGALGGVFYVRTLADADRLREALVAPRRLLVVGGGYVGLEAAAVARKLGLEVTLVEAAPRILQRVASAETAAYFRALHRARGVTIREGVGLTALAGTAGHVTGAVLADGTQIPADVVIAGIGVDPNDALARDAGLAVENGISVDAFCTTGDPDILAAGDCASFPCRGGRIRLESVGNAIDQAEAAASNLMGQPAPYEAKPWFWSDQYDTKLQIAGLSGGHDAVVTRNSGEGSLSFWYFRGEDLLAIDAINDPRAYMVGKRLIEAGRSVGRAILEAPGTDLKALLRG